MNLCPDHATKLDHLMQRIDGNTAKARAELAAVIAKRCTDCQEVE